MSNDLVDHQAEESWRPFLATLVGSVTTLQHGEFVELCTADESRSLMEIVVTKRGRVRATIGGLAFPASFSADVIRRRDEMLAVLGWRLLTRKREFIKESGRSDVRALAELIVRSLVEVWGFTDPASVSVRSPFLAQLSRDHLTQQTPGRHLTAVSDVADTNSTHRQVNSPSSATPALIPRDAAHLMELARTVLSDCMRRDLIVREGVIEVPFGLADRTQIFARTRGGLRLVFSTTLTHRLTDPALLGRVMTNYSADSPEIAILVADDHVHAQHCLNASVFDSRLLEQSFRIWQEFAEISTQVLHAELNPGGPGAHNCTRSGVPIGLQTLIDIQLQDGSLTPDKILHLTNGKAERICEYHSACTELIDEVTGLAREAAATRAPRAEVEHYEQFCALYRHLAELLVRALERAS